MYSSSCTMAIIVKGRNHLALFMIFSDPDNQNEEKTANDGPHLLMLIVLEDFMEKSCGLNYCYSKENGRQSLLFCGWGHLVVAR